MAHKEYTQYLTDEDRVHVSFDQGRGKIMRFSVNYSARVNGRWRQIFRIDNCHGRPHTHRYYLLRKQLRVELGNSNEEAFTGAKKYIVSEFEKIKQNYLQARKRT